MYANIAYHTYNEYNYYEFDVDFDVHKYVNNYVSAIYIHTVIFMAARCNSSIYQLPAIILLTMVATAPESIYYIALACISRNIAIISTIFGAHISN